MSIVIIDYGTGNLRSVQKALQKLGSSAIISNNKAELKNASGIILPGVGSFDTAIKELRDKNLEGSLEAAIALGKPFLGICLGLQLLFEKSEEGRELGFGLIEGKVNKFDFKDTPFSSQTIPHMGWNRLLVKKKSPILDGINDGAMVYFAHSYYVAPGSESVTAAQTDYGINFTSVVWKDNIHAIQFHPEKSGDTGLKILKNFAGLCK